MQPVLPANGTISMPNILMIRTMLQDRQFMHGVQGCRTEEVDNGIVCMHVQRRPSCCHALQERAAAEGCRQPGEAAAEASDVEGASPMDAFAWGSIVLGGPLDVSSEFERRLSVGAAIACRLRGAIRDQLGAPACTC
jgi:hypothetical protein